MCFLEFWIDLLVNRHFIGQFSLADGIMNFRKLNKQTKQKNKQINKQTNKHTKQTNKQTNKQIQTQTKQTNKQTNKTDTNKTIGNISITRVGI